LTQNGYLYVVANRPNAQSPFLAIIDQLTGQIRQQLPVTSISSAFNTFNDQGELFLSNYLPQPAYSKLPFLPPNAQLGVEKFIPCP
jgi:hypothetical protein